MKHAIGSHEWLLGLDDRFWDADKEGRIMILKEVLQAADRAPSSFMRVLEPVELDPERSPLPVVLEALSQDTDQWGDYFVALLDRILDRAETATDPAPVLDLLGGYSHSEKDHRPFIQRIVDRFVEGLDPRCWAVRAACVIPFRNKGPSKDARLFFRRAIR